MIQISPDTWQSHWKIRDFASTSPIMWWLSNMARGRRQDEINRRTHLLIDGFPRSANSRIEAYVSLFNSHLSRSARSSTGQPAQHSRLPSAIESPYERFITT